MAQHCFNVKQRKGRKREKSDGRWMNKQKERDNCVEVMRHGKKRSKGGDMKEISMSQCVSMYCYSVIFILELKLVVI
jgi:hypothetical protein